MWAATRFWMESENVKSKRYGAKSRNHWYALFAATKAFEWMLRITGQYERGFDHAHTVLLTEHEHHFRTLPAGFDGFTILHLSDLHLDGMPGLVERVLDLPGQRAFDLCVFTGDYRLELHGPITQALRDMKHLVGEIRSEHGFLAILGNHDSCHMVAPLEDMGIQMLINEIAFVERGDERIQIVGTDDVHYYYTDQALHALEHARSPEFTLALIHSPELYDMAADLGVDLYLCGHTHGGQICLPNGYPVIRHLSRGRGYFRGLWSFRGMRGFTHGGTGTSGIPIRFNTRGEVAVHTLRCG